MEMVYAVVHGVDVDGICSGAVLNKAYPQCEISFADYPDLMQSLEGIVVKKSGRLVIADLSFSQEWRRRADLFERLAAAHKINIYDHHEGWKQAQEFFKYFEKSVIDLRRCTTEILADEFLRDDEMGKKLALLARAQDFDENNIHHGLSEDLQSLISSGFDKREIVKVLSEAKYLGEIWNTTFDRACREYRGGLERGFERLDERTREYVVRVGDREVVLRVGFAPEVLYMKHPGNYMKEKYPDADLVVAVFGNEAGSVIAWRGSKGNWINVADICTKLGGGGHDFSGGFVLGRRVEEREISKTLDDVAASLISNLSA